MSFDSVVLSCQPKMITFGKSYYVLMFFQPPILKRRPGYFFIIFRHLSHWPAGFLPIWAELNYAGKPTVVGDCRRWKCFMWTPTADAKYSSKTITGGMVENCAHSICIFLKFDYVGDLSQMRRWSTGTDRRIFSVATGDYVEGRSAGYENQPLLKK